MLTISIVTHNHTLEQLTPTLTSIQNLNSANPSYRLIIIDNGDCEWLEEYTKSDSRMVYIKSPKNGGYGYGHNIAISRYAANSDYFLVCNPDIVFEADQLIKLLDIASKTNAGLFMPNIVYPDDSRQELCKILPSPIHLFVRRFLPQFIAKPLDDEYLLRQADFSQSFFAPCLSGCFMLFKSKALINVGGFDERYFMYMEDFDLSRRVAAKYGSYFIADATVTHHYAKGSAYHLKLFLIHIMSTIRYFNKWGWFFDKERKQLNQKCLTHLPQKNGSSSLE